MSVRKQVLASAAAVLKRISPSSTLIGPPKGYYQTMKEYMTQEKVPAHLYHKVYDAQVDIVVPNDPVVIDKTVHWRFTKNRQYTIPEQFVMEIPGGRVTGKSCLVISPGDKVIAEVSRQFGIRGDFSKASILKRVKLPRLQSFDGVLAVVGYAGGDNYWHWMFNILPRIHLLQRSNLLQQCDKILINPLQYPYQHQTLEKLGIPMEKFIFSGEDLHIKAKKLLVPSIPEHQEHVSRRSIDFLLGLFDQRALQSQQPGERVYITRSRSRNRKVINEKELLAVLQPLGFKAYALEELSLAEQARLFGGASIIVSTHGAAQTNLVFSKPGTKVIELVSPLWINYCFWSMSGLLGIEYYYLMAEGDLPTEDNFIIDKGADLFIDLNKFKQILAKAGLTETSVVSR